MTSVINPNKIELWETQLQDLLEVPHAVTFPHLSAGYEAIIYAARTGPYDRIVLPANAPLEAVAPAFIRNMPVRLIDIEQATGTMDMTLTMECLAKRFTRGRTLVMINHFEGAVFDVQQLSNALKDSEIVLIEDASRAWGSSYLNGSWVGSCASSDLTLLHFSQQSPLYAGDVAVVTTHRRDLYERLLSFKQCGRTKQDLLGHKISEISGSYPVMPQQAEIGLSHWDRLEANKEHMRSLMRAYREVLSDIPYIAVFPEHLDNYSLFHGFVAQVDFTTRLRTKEEVVHSMEKEGVTGGLYPIYRQPFCSKIYGEIDESFPRMESFWNSSLILPINLHLQKEDVYALCNKLKQRIQQ